MAPLPAFKFIFLGVRQLTRPLARRFVARANAERGLTHRVCVGLGRVSLGLSGVITSWSQEVRKLAAEREAEDARTPPTPGATLTAQLQKSAPSAPPADGEDEEDGKPTVLRRDGKHAEAKPPLAIITPRSRSLLERLRYGPRRPDDEEARLSASQGLFAPISNQNNPNDKNNNDNSHSNSVARILIRRSYQSAWSTFRATFLADFPEDQLVQAGVDLLIELVAYLILASLLCWELTLQARANAAKEARIDAMEARLSWLLEQAAKDGRLVPDLPTLVASSNPSSSENAKQTEKKSQEAGLPTSPSKSEQVVFSLWSRVVQGVGLVGSFLASAPGDGMLEATKMAVTGTQSQPPS